MHQAFRVSGGSSDNFVVRIQTNMPFVNEGKQYVRKRGNRREVLDRVAFCTSGGLTFDCLEEKNGKIISKRRSQMGRERYATKNPFKAEEKQEEVKAEVKQAEDVEDEKVPAPVKKKTASRQPRVPVVRRRRGRGRRRRRV